MSDLMTLLGATLALGCIFAICVPLSHWVVELGAQLSIWLDRNEPR